MRCKRFPLVTIREFVSLGPETLWPVMNVLAWSINNLFLGIHPSFDYNGVKLNGPLAGLPIAGL